MADGPEAVVVQVETGAQAVMAMTAAVPDAKLTGATPKVSPLLFCPIWSNRLDDQRSVQSQLGMPRMDNKPLQLNDIAFIISNSPIHFDGT